MVQITINALSSILLRRFKADSVPGRAVAHSRLFYTFTTDLVWFKAVICGHYCQVFRQENLSRYLLPGRNNGRTAASSHQQHLKELYNSIDISVVCRLKESYLHSRLRLLTNM